LSAIVKFSCSLVAELIGGLAQFVAVCVDAVLILVDSNGNGQSRREE